MTQENISRKPVAKRAISLLIFLLLQIGLYFIPAGRWDLPWAWAYYIVYLAVMLFNGLLLLPRNPELYAERARRSENVKGWDRWLAPLAAAILPMLTLLVAGLEMRFAPAALSPALHWIGLILYTGGYALITWAMAVNTFFSGYVRIQGERGHTVIQTGPYAVIRHPGYTGMTLFNLAVPLLLGSFWAWIPAIVTAVVFVIRTSMEDATLKAELPGYNDYAQKVHWRLLPGIW